jgi:hypothetical protein
MTDAPAKDDTIASKLIAFNDKRRRIMTELQAEQAALIIEKMRPAFGLGGKLDEYTTMSKEQLQAAIDDCTSRIRAIEIERDDLIEIYAIRFSRKPAKLGDPCTCANCVICDYCIKTKYPDI